MDALIILAAILYAVFSASSQSKKAKKKHDARTKNQTPPLPSIETIERERRAKQPKKKQPQLFDAPEKKAAPAMPEALPRKKRKAPVIIEETPAHKTPLAPVKKSEHEHQHKNPVQSRLSNRTYVGIKSQYQKQTAPMEVQILAASSEQSPQAAGFKLKTDRDALIEGIIWNEVLGKPKGLRR